MNMTEAKVGRIIFARLVEDEDLLEAVAKRVEKADIKAGLLFIIGSLKRAQLGFFNGEKYVPIKLNEPLEIVSAIGNVSLDEKDRAVIHVHLVVSNKQGEAFGGHLLSGCVVSFTAELVIVECVGTEVRRFLDAKTGLHLWRP